MQYTAFFHALCSYLCKEQTSKASLSHFHFYWADLRGSRLNYSVRCHTSLNTSLHLRTRVNLPSWVGYHQFSQLHENQPQGMNRNIYWRKIEKEKKSKQRLSILQQANLRIISFCGIPPSLRIEEWLFPSVNYRSLMEAIFIPGPSLPCNNPILSIFLNCMLPNTSSCPCTHTESLRSEIILFTYRSTAAPLIWSSVFALGYQGSQKH